MGFVVASEMDVIGIFPIRGEFRHVQRRDHFLRHAGTIGTLASKLAG